MKLRSTKFAALAAALMISAPLALAATPTFAADYHDGDRDNSNYRGDNDRHDGDRNNYRSDNDRRDGDQYSYRSDRHDNDRDGMRHMSYRHTGHWGYSHHHRMWFAFFGR
ncbi:MAG TPA: hypothetical protein VGT78_04295 [Rhizomicrobium sp.]|nr:hypothetical protein [Rhizomicrobium sp.]